MPSCQSAVCTNRISARLPVLSSSPRFARHRECRSVRRQVPGCASACLTVIGMTDLYRTLVLLRHAKSDYPPGVADHERPLAPRGEREAVLACDWLRAHAPAVDAVLCSTATRTRETLARTRIDAPVNYVDRLYDATPGTVIEEINTVESRFGPDVEILLVIGHERTMSSVALGLATAAGINTTAADGISTQFPPFDISRLRTGQS